MAAKISRHTEGLPQATSGDFVISIPFPAGYISVINQSLATILFIEGQPYAQSTECTPVEPGGYLSTLIRTDQKVKVFWSAPTPLPQGSLVSFTFSDAPIPIQAGNITPNSSNSNVSVTNAPNVNVVTMPHVVVDALPAVGLAAGGAAIGTVGVTALPALAAGANAIGTVGVTALPAVKELGDSFLNFSAATVGTQVKAGPGTLKKVIISNPGTTMVVSLFDGLSAVNPIATIAAAFGVLEFNVAFGTGLFVVVAGTVGDVTVSYQ